jgi:biopolymer transport protein TolR
MGMTVGVRNGGPVAEPNIVPLIDVLLVLIIIFMVITPRVPTGLPTLVPQPSPPNAPAQPSVIVVQVLPGDSVKINEDASTWDELGERLSLIFSTRADKVAFVQSGGDVSFAQVARAIDIMRGAGIEHVGLVTPGTNKPR